MLVMTLICDDNIHKHTHGHKEKYFNVVFVVVHTRSILAVYIPLPYNMYKYRLKYYNIMTAKSYKTARYAQHINNVSPINVHKYKQV